MRFPFEGQWSGREKCTLPLLRLTSAFLRKGANPSTMVSTSCTPPSRKRSRMTLRADGLRAVLLRAVCFAMATSLRLRHHHSTITPARAAGRGRPSGADVMSRRPPRTRRPSARAPRPATVKVIIEAAKRGERVIRSGSAKGRSNRSLRSVITSRRTISLDSLMPTR